MPQNDSPAEFESALNPDIPARILSIDDDQHVRWTIAKILQKHGFEVVSAAWGAEGIRLAGEQPPDLVICDLNMPGMNGYEVLMRLRADARLADIPVIFLTAQSEPEQVRAGMNLGADDYLTKPCDPTELLRAVRARLMRSQLARQHQKKQIDRAMQMFGEIVHDLRDPLFVVCGYTNLLRQDAPGQTPTEARSGEILDRMQQAVARMQTIVAETLFLAKSKMQRLPFDPGPMDLRVLCEQVISDHDQSARLQFECGVSECAAVGDPLRLRQALENLLANALKYSENQVAIRLLKVPGSYRIEVADQGIGIPEPERGQIFNPFFRASNTAGKPGHGLGLSIVKTCVEQHGGTVQFQSELGQGTTFTIELPVLPAAPRTLTNEPASDSVTKSPDSKVEPPQSQSAAADSAAEPAEPPAKLRSIIVDDDPLVRDVMRDLLISSGEVEVVGEAGSVARARQLVEQHDPEVVFLDIRLADGLGFELLPHLPPETSVVFVTSAEEYAVTAFDSDAVDYLLKPVSAARLQKTLERVRRQIPPRPTAAKAAQLGLDDTFLVKTMSEKKLIPVRDVKRVIAYGEYSWVYWNQEKGALLRKPLKQWEAELPASHFIRVHRHAIINLSHLARLEKLPSGRLLVHLRDTPESIAVSLRLAPALNRKLKTFTA